MKFGEGKLSVYFRTVLFRQKTSVEVKLVAKKNPYLCCSLNGNV